MESRVKKEFFYPQLITIYYSIVNMQPHGNLHAVINKSFCDMLLCIEETRDEERLIFERVLCQH